MVRYVITRTRRRCVDVATHMEAGAGVEVQETGRQQQSQQHLNPLAMPPAPTPSPTTPIDLLRGHPTTRLLATTPFLSATTTILSTPLSLPQNSYAPTRHPLAYGPDFGNLDVRREIIAWQEEFYGGEELDMAPSTASSRRGSTDPNCGAGGGVVEAKEAGDPQREARINLTCGASYGFMNALMQCTSPGTGYTRRAFIVSPAYFLACAIFIDAGFTNLLTPLPYPPPPGSPQKTLPDLLLSHLQADAPSPSNPHVPLSTGLGPIGGISPRKPRGGKRIYKYVLYCVPTHGNPTGLTWDFETRRRVVEIAREWDVLVICDDVYDFLPWGDISHPESPRPLPRLVTLDRQLILAHWARESGRNGEEGDMEAGNVLSNCSFSKLLGPGLRCGWQESATGVLARQLAEGGANHSGGCPSQFVSAVVGELLRPVSGDEAEDKDKNGKAAAGSGEKGGKKMKRKINEIIAGVKSVLGSRASLFIDACYKYLPPGSEVLGYPPVSTSPPRVNGGGGYFLWVSLGPPPPPGQPPAYNAREIVKLAAQGEPPIGDAAEVEGGGEWINKVTVGSGDLFECPGNGNEMGFGERWVRIAVSWCEEVEGVEGIRRLGRACTRWMHERVREHE